MDGDRKPVSRSRAKRRVNLTLRADLVREARCAGLNLSQLAEAALEARLRERRAQRWQEENRQALEAYNRRIEKRGLWHKGLTPWY